MTRLIGPANDDRLAYYLVTAAGTTKNVLKGVPLTQATFYDDLDPAAEPTLDMLTSPADILTLAGAPIPDSTVTINAVSQFPLLQFPDGSPVGPNSLLVRVATGPAYRVYARPDDQIESLGAAVTALQAGVSSAETPTGAQSKVDAHSADTTGVHGIADTSLLETQSGAQAKASAAQSAAITAAATDATIKASAAQSAAVTAAATDATTKANAAQSAATSAAAADAATKASAAQAAAISAAATDATTKANAAQSAAISAAASNSKSADTITDGTTNKAYTATEKTKLAGVAAGATANSTDAQLRDRSLHTGAQPISSVTGLQTALDGKPDKAASWLSTAGYVVGDGVADDTAGFNTALAAAAAVGAAVFVPNPPVRYRINGSVTVYAGQTIRGAGRNCEIRQYNRANKPVFDCLNIDGVTIGGFKVVLDGGPLTTVGSAWRAENGYTGCAAVWTNGSSNTIHDLKVVDMAVPVMLSAYDGVSAQSLTMRTGNVVRDLEISGANFGILFMGQDALRIHGINAHDLVDSSSGGNPLHTFYGTGNASLRGRNLVVSDCVTRNVSFGCAYQVKYVDGITMTNMLAENCQGLFNGIDISDAAFGDMISRSDTAGSGASFAIQKVTTQPARITIDSVTINKVADAVGADRCVSVIADDVKVSNLHLFPNLTVASSNYAAYLRGARMTVDGVKITNIGSQRIRGILVGFSASFPTSDVSVKDFEMTNVGALVDFETSITGTNVASYDPGAQRDIGAATNYFNQVGGTASFSLSRREWVRTTAVSAGSTATPVPALETVTRLDVTDTTGFAIAAPAGIARVGMTQEVLIVNSSGGSLGTIVWNAAFALRGSFVAPPAGEAHRILFAYAGTSWREISRSPGAGTGVSDSLNALAADALSSGEIIPHRTDITSTAIGAVSGVVYLSYFTADKTESINTLTAFTGSVAAAATPTLCRMGVYSVAANGDLSLLASTANDTTLFAASTTSYPKALSSSFSKVVGQRYAVALIIVSAGTMPNFQGKQLASTNAINSLVRVAPAIIGRQTGQTDLPSSILAGSLTGYQAQIAMQMS